MKKPTGKPQGRPIGYSPGQTRKITHRVGAWSWDTDKLHSRIVKTTPDACWAWTGSYNNFGNIFGAFKNDRQQMVQANRLLYIEQVNEPIDHLSIKTTCKNRHCSNPSHFYTDKNNRYKP
jgi:hypothetical protein